MAVCAFYSTKSCSNSQAWFYSLTMNWIQNVMLAFVFTIKCTFCFISRFSKLRIVFDSPLDYLYIECVFLQRCNPLLFSRRSFHAWCLFGGKHRAFNKWAWLSIGWNFLCIWVRPGCSHIEPIQVQLRSIESHALCDWKLNHAWAVQRSSNDISIEKLSFWFIIMSVHWLQSRCDFEMQYLEIGFF